MSKSKLTLSKMVLRASVVLALVAVTAFIAPIIFGGLGPGGGYRIVFSVFLVVCYLLILPSFLLVIFGKAASRVLRNGVAITSTIVLLAVAVLAFGAVQDLAGTYCTGFFGVRQPCIETAWFGVFLAITYPLTFIPLASVVIGLLSVGLADEYRRSRTVEG